MEQESFENDRIAALLNREYVCVKVDREERPDSDGRTSEEKRGGDRAGPYGGRVKAEASAAEQLNLTKIFVVTQF